MDSEIDIKDGYTVELNGITSLGMISENNGAVCGPVIGTQPMPLIAPVGSSELMINSGDISEGAKVSFENGSYEILNTTSINEEIESRAVTSLPVGGFVAPSLIGAAIVIWLPTAVSSSDDIYATIKNWKIYNGNILVSDMYPATHNDGRDGLYCTIRDKFLPIQYYP